MCFPLFLQRGEGLSKVGGLSSERNCRLHDVNPVSPKNFPCCVCEGHVSFEGRRRMLFGPYSHSALAAGSYTAIVRERAPSIRLLSTKMCSVPSTNEAGCESLLRGVLTAGEDKSNSLLE